MNALFIIIESIHSKFLRYPPYMTYGFKVALYAAIFLLLLISYPTDLRQHHSHLILKPLPQSDVPSKHALAINHSWFFLSLFFPF